MTSPHWKAGPGNVRGKLVRLFVQFHTHSCDPSHAAAHRSATTLDLMGSNPMGWDGIGKDQPSRRLPRARTGAKRWGTRRMRRTCETCLPACLLALPRWAWLSPARPENRTPWLELPLSSIQPFLDFSKGAMSSRAKTGFRLVSYATLLIGSLGRLTNGRRAGCPTAPAGNHCLDGRLLPAPSSSSPTRANRLATMERRAIAFNSSL